ncbi:MFS general substrate transporter [Basidiobolus meristosporus CBS 931.73]|uniref:MFS general substrate transporter n=1 Tax=Basidiobolus meristosporus CBS 931.73 TaxID=1314790 RepID=A0A1Y1XUG5_9FUNG|nr:MFS general substrate transporter [Basidiobolus meristosporus CBS 931.73]|eukprot:ORX89390.1 MFS general substrate transporter [Basidiobolus meristosporus CBS 931.73]
MEKEHSWDKEAERRIVRKYDIRILPLILILYTFSILDRINLGNARLYNLEEDLNLKSGEFGWCLSIFFFGYIIFEIPSNNFLKRARPSRWISRIMVSWGIISSCGAAVHNFGGLMSVRFFLGIAEAGFFPGVIYYFSFWYTRKEQATRIGFLFAISLLASGFSGILAYAISHMHNNLGLAAWQWIFLIEGIPSIVFGILTFFILPDFPETVSWLTEEEREIAIKRLEMEGTIASDTKFDRGQFLASFTDVNVLLYLVLYFTVLTPSVTLSMLLPTIISSLGFTNVTAQLLSTPPYVVAFFSTIAITHHSDKIMQRGIYIMTCATCCIVGFILLIVLNGAWVLYGCLVFIAICLYVCMPLCFAWISNNVRGSTKVATSTALVSAFGNIGGAVGGQFFRAEEAPRYQSSHIIFICLLALTVIISFTLRIRFKRENDRIARRASGLSKDLEKSEYGQLMQKMVL